MTDDLPTAGPLGEAGARLRAIRDRVRSIQGCVNRTRSTCSICDGQLLVVLQDLDALLSAPVVSPPENAYHALRKQEPFTSCPKCVIRDERWVPCAWHQPHTAVVTQEGE